jgi:hypothetical protein
MMKGGSQLIFYIDGQKGVKNKGVFSYEWYFNCTNKCVAKTY